MVGIPVSPIFTQSLSNRQVVAEEFKVVLHSGCQHLEKHVSCKSEGPLEPVGPSGPPMRVVVVVAIFQQIQKDLLILFGKLDC